MIQSKNFWDEIDRLRAKADLTLHQLGWLAGLTEKSIREKSSTPRATTVTKLISVLITCKAISSWEEAEELWKSTGQITEFGKAEFTKLEQATILELIKDKINYIQDISNLDKAENIWLGTDKRLSKSAEKYVNSKELKELLNIKRQALQLQLFTEKEKASNIAELVAVLEDSTLAFNAIQFNQTGNLLFSVNGDRAIRVQELKPNGEPTAKNYLREFSGHQGYVFSLAVSRDGQLTATGSSDQTIKLWQNDNDGLPIAPQIATLRLQHGKIWWLAFDKMAQILVTSGETSQNDISLWDIKDIQNIQKIGDLKGHTDQVWEIRFNSDYTRLVSSSSDSTVKIWDVKNRAEVRTLVGHSAEVSCVAYSPDGTTIASADWEGNLRLWSAVSGREIKLFSQAHAGKIWALAYSPNSRLLATGGTDGVVKLWNVDTLSELGELGRHNSSITSLAFNPKGEVIASTSDIPKKEVNFSDKDGGSIKLWRLKS